MLFPFLRVFRDLCQLTRQLTLILLSSILLFGCATPLSPGKQSEIKPSCTVAPALVGSSKTVNESNTASSGVTASSCDCRCKAEPSASSQEQVQFHPQAWSEIPGWSEDAHQQAWPAFLQSCQVLGKKPVWAAVCSAAQSVRWEGLNDNQQRALAREFFEQWLSAYALQRVNKVGDATAASKDESADAEKSADKDLCTTVASGPKTRSTERSNRSLLKVNEDSEYRATPYLGRAVGCAEVFYSGLVTGYYEPVLRGSQQPSPRFTTPLYAVPKDLLTIDLGSLYPDLAGRRLRGRLQGNRITPYPSRAEIANYPAVLQPLVWVDDAVEAFFLEIQGSGQVQLLDPTGKHVLKIVRLAYADQNGHPYQSIGRWLIDQGELAVHEASMQGIQQWVRSNPGRLQELFNKNPSVVFFREETVPLPDTENLPVIARPNGPKGALGVPLSPERSIAIDPKFIPLGAPVFLSSTYPNSSQPLQRLVMAQDTGGAIRGVVRADFFWGLGASAGIQAGKMRQKGQMWLLWPKNSKPG